MSILNLRLQNVPTERDPCDDESIEKKVKKCNNMAELRELDGKVSGVKEAWPNSIDEMKKSFSERFSLLSLKKVPFTEVICVSDKELSKKADETDRPPNKIRKERKQPKNDILHDCEFWIQWFTALNVRSCLLFIP